MAENLAIVDFTLQLKSRMTSIKSMLPEHITIERFMRTTTTAVQRNPGLLNMNRDSLFLAVSDCAKDGLIPDNREAAFVQFKNDVVYMPMVSGILKKIRQSGDLLSISSVVVYEKELFKYHIDENGSHLHHEPKLVGDPGEPIGVYAIAETKDGGKYVEVLRMSDIKKIQNTSKAKRDDSPWNMWWEEMAKKSAIRRLAKRLPMSTEIIETIHRDDIMYDQYDNSKDVTPEYDNMPVADKVRSKLKDKMINKNEKEDIKTPKPKPTEKVKKKAPEQKIDNDDGLDIF